LVNRVEKQIKRPFFFSLYLRLIALCKGVKIETWKHKEIGKKIDNLGIGLGRFWRQGVH